MIESDADLSRLKDSELVQCIDHARNAVKTTKAMLAGLEGELSERMGGFAQQLLDSQGKDSGSVTFERGGMKFKADAKKSVKWDSRKLQGIAAGMKWPDVERLFDIKFSIKETIYKAIPDADFVAKLDEARTTEIAPVKVTPVSTQ